MGSQRGEIIKKLDELDIGYDPKAPEAELAKLLPAKEASKKDDAVDKTAPELKKSDKTVTRKIKKDELLSLQKEGKLVGYNPANGMGEVREVGNKIKFPAGEAEIV